MHKYAIAYISFMENELHLAIIHAHNWQGALIHLLSDVGLKSNHIERILDSIGDDLEKAYDRAYQQDWAFKVVKL